MNKTQMKDCKTHFTKERTIDERQTDPKITGILLANQTRRHPNHLHQRTTHVDGASG
ncbi:hypothetical protein QJS10_CPB14g00821 [Acorus calamus]|uniref:Uncharacterized protein n=1 Tax=Acorus calamus TaxID=4465 RepID=A0AAV9DC93_ACOCL|nr:hypothetical protein QJS10_CPB14g00821 [Acorus calamus]